MFENGTNSNRTVCVGEDRKYSNCFQFFCLFCKVFETDVRVYNMYQIVILEIKSLNIFKHFILEQFPQTTIVVIFE